MEKSLKFRQSKDNISVITDNTQIKLHAHHLTMVIYTQYKFHALPSIGYLVMAEDGKPTVGWRNGMDRQRQTNIPPSVVDNGVYHILCNLLGFRQLTRDVFLCS